MNIKTDNGIEQAWLFNPSNYPVTYSDPEREGEFVIEHMGSFDIISHPGGFAIGDYAVNGTQVILSRDRHLMPLFVYMDSQVIAHQAEIDELRADIEKLQKKIMLLEANQPKPTK